MLNVSGSRPGDEIELVIGRAGGEGELAGGAIERGGGADAEPVGQVGGVPERIEGAGLRGETEGDIGQATDGDDDVADADEGGRLAEEAAVKLGAGGDGVGGDAIIGDKGAVH